MYAGIRSGPYTMPFGRIETDRRLDDSPAYFIWVCGFTFEFWSTDQIAVALKFFERKVHPSSRASTIWGGHDVMQRWYERIPIDLQKNGKRERVAAALEKALAKFS